MSRVLDRSRLEELLRQEEARFHAEHPCSFALYQQARQSISPVKIREY